MTESRHGLAPEIALTAKDEFLVYAIRHGFVGVGVFEAADAVGGRFCCALALVQIEITEIPGGHDDGMLHLRSRDTPGHPAPAHHGGFRSEATFEDLVPANELFAFGIDHFLDPLYKIALQLVYIAEMLVLHASCTFWTSGPEALVRFV